MFKNSEHSKTSLEPEHSRLTLGQIRDRLSETVKEPSLTTFERITADNDLVEDVNCGTFLLRTALSNVSVLSGQGAPPTTMRPTDQAADGQFDVERLSAMGEEERFSHHIDQAELQKKRHSKLVSYLTLPQSVVRNFRDDISLIVIGLKEDGASSKRA